MGYLDDKEDVIPACDAGIWEYKKNEQKFLKKNKKSICIDNLLVVY